MKIGYSKIGRSWKLDPRNGTATGGDADVARTLHLLSRTYPDAEIHLLGRCTEIDPVAAGYPSNVINPWLELAPKMKAAFKEFTKKEANGQISKDSVGHVLDWHERITAPMFTEMDAHIVWSGQHGTSNTKIPQVEDRSIVTNPQDSFTLYASFILMGLNMWRDMNPDREELWLCPDPRNYLKARDLKWPLRHPIIAQYEYARTTKHERFGDRTDPSGWDAKWDPKSNEGVWIAPSKYAYSALEMTAVPNPLLVGERVPWELRYDFGMVVNENRAYVAKDRLSALQNWVLPYWPEAEIFGKWSAKSMETLGRPDIRPVPYEHLPNTLQRWRTTLTTPASGSGWATAKPWECFAYGVVCFFHPQYDDQDWILRDAPQALHDWLRVQTPEDLKMRVDLLSRDQAAWEWLVAEQHKYYIEKYNETLGGTKAIIDRLEAM